MNKKRKIQIFTSILAGCMAVSGCGSIKSNNINTKSTETTQSMQTKLKKLGLEYYKFFDKYKVKYLHPEYLASDTNVEDLKEIMSSKKECDYINYDNPPKIMNMLKKNTNNFIKENSDYGYVNALDVSKLSDSFVDSTTYYNYEKITSFINGVIYDEVEKMVSGSLAGDNDEDLCKMRNLKVLLDTGTQVYNKSGGTTLARYDEEINSIIIYLDGFLHGYSSKNSDEVYSMEENDSIPLENYEMLKVSVLHEINHIRQNICDDRKKINGQLNDTISYDNDVITSLLESSAESSIYTEGGMDFNPEYDSNNYYNSNTYTQERSFENELFLLSITDNDKKLDDYYASIFNSDIEGLINYFDLKGDNDIKAFLNILKQYDAINLRNNLAIYIDSDIVKESNFVLPRAINAIGRNWKLDLLRLSLRNLINYNLENKKKLSKEEIVTLEKIILYQVCDYACTYETDINGNLKIGSDSDVIATYDKSFVNQFIELENKFNNYIMESYNMSSTEYMVLSNKVNKIVSNMYSKTRYNNNSTPNNEFIEFLLEKFPKLKVVVPRLGDTQGISYRRVKRCKN